MGALMGAYNGCGLFFDARRTGVPLLPSIAPKFRGLESGKTITDAQRPIVPAKSPIRKYSRYCIYILPFRSPPAPSIVLHTTSTYSCSPPRGRPRYLPYRSASLRKMKPLLYVPRAAPVATLFCRREQDREEQTFWYLGSWMVPA